MLPSKHIIFGFMFSSILLFIFPDIGIIGFSIIFLSSFLIDVDHYLLYVFTKKDWSLKKSHKFFSDNYRKMIKLPVAERKKIKPQVYLFHGLEATLIIALLSFTNIFFLYILIGILFHQFLDLIALIYFQFPMYKLQSQTYNFLKTISKK